MTSPIDELARLRAAAIKRRAGKTEISITEFTMWAFDNTAAIVSERDALRERAELAELLCRARGDMERVTEAEYEKLLAERDAEIARLRESYATIRDAVLHNRHQLAEMEVDSDIINAVLGIIDDNFTEET